jgi:hypothetical protein
MLMSKGGVAPRDLEGSRFRAYRTERHRFGRQALASPKTVFNRRLPRTAPGEYFPEALPDLRRRLPMPYQGPFPGAACQLASSSHGHLQACFLRSSPEVLPRPKAFPSRVPLRRSTNKAYR